MLDEKDLKAFPGWLMVALLSIIPVLSVIAFIWSVKAGSGYGIGASIVVFIIDLVCLGGFTVVNPNEAKVVQLFGIYKGSIKKPGFWWVNPLTTRRRVSLRVRNFESSKLKVNDQDGNPIEIAAVVVWRVVETAEALFQVDDYEHFVHVQSESAVRNLATSLPVRRARGRADVAAHVGATKSPHQLREEIQERLAKAGVEVIEARISHLAYAPEIANAMLRRQQATAIIAARQKIVEGAVGMVEMALELLSAKHVVELDEERKASMVSNLLVVLCSDRDAQPIVNAGTLYQ